MYRGGNSRRPNVGINLDCMQFKHSAAQAHRVSLSARAICAEIALGHPRISLSPAVLPGYALRTRVRTLAALPPPFTRILRQIVTTDVFRGIEIWKCLIPNWLPPFGLLLAKFVQSLMSFAQGHCLPPLKCVPLCRG